MPPKKQDKPASKVTKGSKPTKGGIKKPEPVEMVKVAVKPKYSRKEDNLEIYIYRVLKKTQPEISIGKQAMTTLNGIML